MKYKIFGILILNVLLFSSKDFGQNVDSISINITRRSPYPDPWNYTYQTIDSFSNDLIKSKLFRQWNNNSWSNYNLVNYNYNGSFLTQKIFQYWDTTQWLNGQRNLYSTSLPIDSAIEQYWHNGWGNYHLTLTYHDIKNLDSVIINKYWHNSNWIERTKTENTFSSDSSYLSQTISVWDTIQSLWKLSNRNLWFNDSLQRDTAIIEQKYDSGSWLNYLGTFYNYDASGLIVHELIAGWDDLHSNWSYIHNEFFKTYDLYSRLIFVHVDNYPGGFSEAKYYYDTLGNLVEDSSHYESMGGIITNSNDHWYFLTYPSSPDLYLFVSDDFTKCSKDSIVIGSFAFGGNYPLHFSWTPSAGLSSDTIENPIVFSDSSILYTAVVTDNNGNFISDGLNIIVYNETEITSVTSVSTTCIGCSDGQFIIDFGVNDLYDIYVIPNPGATILNDTISGLPAGIYTICAGNATTCTTCVVDTILDDVTTVSENVNEKIVFYPNPFSSSAELYYKNAGENTVIDVLDGFGRLVKTVKINSSVTTISGNGLSPGTYFGILHSGNTVIARMKLIYLK